MAITKSISFFAPYIVNELNAQIDNIAGGDALLYGGEITVQTSTTVDIAPYIFVQDGITVFQDEVTAGVTVPDFSTFTGPVHILVSSPDSKNTSGVLMSVAEGNQDTDENAIVLASRTQNVWSNPHKPSLIELRKDALLSRADASGARLSDADVEFDDGYKGWGTNQGFHLNQGEVSDSAGAKTALVVDTSLGEPNSSIEFDLTSVDPDFPRTDCIVARRVSENLNAPPEIVYAKGETLSLNNPYFEQASTTGSRSISVSAGNTTPSVAYNATGEHVVVFGNGTNLNHARLDHTATRAIGVGPTATAAGGTVSDVFLAERKDIASGDRLYGCCVVGTEIAIFRTTANGASIGVSDIHIFTSMTNTPSQPHMVVTGEGTTDSPLYAHIVFQHPEAPPNNSQIYYTKYALADVTWGTAGAVAVHPRFARGFNGGLNHTNPYIQAHPDGDLHIAYVHAGGALTVGEIRYLVINQAGEVVTPEQALATGTNEVNDGTGTGITLGSAGSEQPKVVISPQGSVYVVWVDLSEAVLANEAVVAWEPTMLERTGFDAVVLYSTSSLNNFQWHSAFSDDLGNLCWFGTTYVAGDGDEITGFWFKFAPILVSDGINIDPDNLNTEFDTGFTNSRFYSGDNNSSGEAILDRDGSISVVDLETNGVAHHKFSSMARVELFQDKRQVHPRDRYIAQISIPVGASNIISSAADVHVHSTKIKSLPPITVFGKDGQKGTFTGLQDAIWSLRGVGGRILVKGGEYEFLYPIEVLSGVEIVGDGHVVFVQSGYNTAIKIESLNYLTITTSDATRRIYSISGGGVSNLLQYCRVGDVGFLWDWSTRPLDNRSEFSDPFVVTKILDNSTFQASRDLSSEITSLGANARVSIYSTGTKLQNLTIYDNRSAGLDVPLVDIESTYFSVFKDLYIVQTQGVATVVDSRGSYGTRFENVIIDKVASNLCFNMEERGAEIHNFDTTLSHCAFRGDASLADFVGLRVNGCVAENWTVTGTPTEVPVWTNNAGAISATSFDTAASWAGDASVFANRIVLNEDAAFDTNGNVRGNLVPIDADSAVGNTTKKWEEAVAQSHVSRPENTSDGLVVDAQDLTNYWYNSEKVGKIVDYTGQIVDEMETTGNWAGCNILEDDFMYVDESWLIGGTEATSEWPDEKYTFPGPDINLTPNVYITASPPSALITDSGGVLQGSINASAEEFVMEGCKAFNGGALTATKKIIFKAKYSMGGTTDPLLHRTDELGLIAGSDYKIFVRYTETSGTPTNWKLVVDDGSNPETAIAIPAATPVSESWRIFYIVIDSAKVEAWTNLSVGALDKTSIAFGADPAPPDSADQFAPYWRMLQGTTANSKDGFLDYWRVQNHVLRR